MSYTPTNWKNGDTITSVKLNNIEEGVNEVNSEYTPTNWQNGDIITAEKLNNIEQGIVNSSGWGGTPLSVRLSYRLPIGDPGFIKTTINIPPGATSFTIPTGSLVTDPDTGDAEEVIGVPPSLVVNDTNCQYEFSSTDGLVLTPYSDEFPPDAFIQLVVIQQIN